MKSQPSPLSGALARLCLISAALLFAGGANAAVPIASKVVLDKGDQIAFTYPAAAVDSKGNIHIVAAGSPTGQLDVCRDRCNIYYLLVNQSGSVLIKATQINVSGADNHGHPQIGVTPTGKAVITWGGGSSSSGGEFTRYAMVDPSLQGSLNGSALKPAALVVPETTIGTSAHGHHTLLVDKNGIAYVLRNQAARSSTSPLTFLKFNPATGAVLHAEAAIGTPNSYGRAFPSATLDSQGNIHVVYAAIDVDGDAPAAYMMLDNDGNILIAPTQLYDKVPGFHPHVQRQHLAVMVDAANKVNVVYGDKRNTPDENNWCNVCASGGTSVYTRLDPSKVPHNGGASTVGALRIGPDQEIPGFWYGRAFLGGDNLVHLIAGVGKTGSLAHVAFSPSNGTIAKQPTVHTGATLNGMDYGPKFVAGAQNKVIWAESVPDGTTLRLVMAPIASFY